MSDVQLAQKVAGVRQQVCGGLSASACDTKITQLKGDEQTKALTLFGTAMAGTPLTKALIEAAPALAAAAKVTLEACVASPVLCANKAGIAVSDILGADALGGATVAAGSAVATGKVASKLEQDLAVIKAANTVKLEAALGARQHELAKQLNNFYRDGAPPEQIQQVFNQAALSSTNNANVSEVVLGRYIAGSASSYDEVAKAKGSTYFSMSDWNTVQGQLGQDQMWNINKAFLDQQIEKGKSFVFTADPRAAKPDSYTALEFKHLSDNGYKIEVTNGEFHATKK